MYPKLIIAAALFAAMSTSAFAEEWNLVGKPGVGGCSAVQREAGAGENKVAGPYQTQDEAEAAKKEFAACTSSTSK